MTFSKMVKRLGRAVAPVGVALLIPAMAPAATEMSQVIPKDSVFAAWCDDVPGFKEDMLASPYGKLWLDPSMEQFRQMLNEQIAKAEEEAKSEGTPTLTEIVENLKGGIAFYITRVDPSINNGDDLARTSVIELDDQGKEWLDKKIASIDELFQDPKKESFESNGVTVYKITGELKLDETGEFEVEEGVQTVHYAYLENLFVMSDGADDTTIKNAINIIKGGAAGNVLADREEYRVYNERAPFSAEQANFFFDVKSLVTNEMEESVEDPTTAAALPATGLYDLEAGFASAFLDNGIFRTTMGVVTKAEKQGLLQAYKDAGSTPLEMLSYVPGDALSATSFSLDVGAIYDAVLGILQKANPQIANMAQMQVMATQQQYGVDVVNNILKNLSGEHLVIERPFDDEIAQQLSPEESALQRSMAIFLGLKNGEQASDAIRGLVQNLMQDPNMGSAISTRESNGMTLVEFNIPGMEDEAINWEMAFNQQMVILANNRIQLQQAIRAVADKEQGMMSDPGAASLMARAEEIDKTDLYAFSYTPPSAVKESIESVQQFLSMGVLAEIGSDFDANMIPSGDIVSGFIGDTYSTVHFGERLLFLDVLVAPPAQQRTE